MSRAIAERCPRLDIRELNRRSLRIGRTTISYSTGSSISLNGIGDRLMLSYQTAGESIRCDVRIVETPVHFGGEREWFLCPGCWRRCAILYMADRRFFCRVCNGLAYRTQHEHADGRLMIKAERLWKRAGCDFGGEGERPKGMHRRTFHRLLEAADEAHSESWHTGIVARLLAKARR